MNYMILVSVVLPILVGVILLFLPANVLKNRQYLLKVTGLSFLVCAFVAGYVVSGAAG